MRRAASCLELRVGALVALGAFWLFYGGAGRGRTNDQYQLYDIPTLWDPILRFGGHYQELDGTATGELIRGIR